MGLILSQTERQQFIEAIKIAREIGWQDYKIAKQLGLANGKYKSMREGFEVPSPKHVHRLNELLKSKPPKSIAPPPAPAEPAAKSAEPTPPFVGDDGGAPRNFKPSKEEPMTTTSEVTNGHNPNSNGNARYLLLPASTVKPLRRAMNEALDTKWDSDLGKMADELKITKRGLQKTLTSKDSSISELTLQKFSSATGWAPGDAKSAADKPAADKRKRNSNNHRTDLTRLSASQNTRFAGELRNAAKRLGSLSEISRRIGVHNATLSMIARGGGSTRETYARFRKLLEEEGATATHARPVKTARALPAAPRVTQRAPQTDAGELDLYNMAGRLLAAGKPAQAHFLSVVARASETVAMSELIKALSALTPLASPS